MKKNLSLLLALALMALGSCKQSAETGPQQAEGPGLDYFQLSKYNFQTAEQLSMLEDYFRQALLPALHRAGVRNVGVFKPIPGLNEEENFIMLMVPYKSLKHFEKTPFQLDKDPEYQEAATAYVDAPHDQAPYSRIESFLLRSFTYTPRLVLPDLSTPRSERVYELRSYEAATEKLYQLKVEMFNEGESAIFQKLKFNPVMFSEVLSSSHMPHLMYMTTHADTTAQKENWNAFRVHPDWEHMKQLERYQNTVSKITIYQLYPTEYSDY